MLVLSASARVYLASGEQGVLPSPLKWVVIRFKLSRQKVTRLAAQSARNTPEQEALIDMAEADKKVGISKEDAEAYKELGKGAGVPVRVPREGSPYSAALLALARELKPSRSRMPIALALGAAGA